MMQTQTNKHTHTDIYIYMCLFVRARVCVMLTNFTGTSIDERETILN